MVNRWRGVDIKRASQNPFMCLAVDKMRPQGGFEEIGQCFNDKQTGIKQIYDPKAHLSGPISKEFASKTLQTI